MADQNGSLDERPGKLRYGFNVIARDLDRAFAVARFDSLQALLIQQARELSYMVAKIANLDDPVPFRINISALARATERSRSWLSKGFKELVQCRVFLALEDGSFLINKDFRQWTDTDDQIRLTRAQVRWCVSVRRNKPITPNCVAYDTPPVSHTTHPPVSHTTHPPVSHTTHPLCRSPIKPLQSEPLSPTPPVEERARGINSESKEREENTPLTPPHGGSSSRSRSRLGKKERQEQIVAENVRIALDGLFSKPQPKPAEGPGDARL